MFTDVVRFGVNLCLTLTVKGEDRWLGKSQTELWPCVFITKIFYRFCDIFLQSSPRIKPLFAHMDLKKQKEVLRTGLAMLLAHVEEKTAGTMTVSRKDESHKKTNMNIEPNLEPIWILNLVKSVKEHDQQWNSDLAGKWE